jgi:non-ribosomal peptide synthase protein (TIGR01720 family)
LVLAHHLCVDGISWRIVLDDLRGAYQQLAAGKAVSLPPKTTSFKTWSETLTHLATTHALSDEIGYWSDPARKEVAALPIDHPEHLAANTSGNIKTLLRTLERGETQIMLEKIPAAIGARADEVMLTALVLTFRDLTGAQCLLVDMESHGREELIEDVDLSRTVGWFTAIHPVLLDLRGATDPGIALRTIMDQVRGVPNRGVGYGVLRYLSDDEAVRAELRDLPSAKVAFNYLGQFDLQDSEGSSFFTPSREGFGDTFDSACQRSHYHEIGCSIYDGTLDIQWDYCPDIHDAETVSALADGFLRHLGVIVAHAETLESTSATGFETQLDHDDLEDLLDKYGDFDDDEDF